MPTKTTLPEAPPQALEQEESHHKHFRDLYNYGNPDEILKDKGGRCNLRLMMHDATIWSAWEKRWAQTRACQYELVHDEPSVIDRVNELIDECVFEKAIDMTLLAPAYGYVIGELQWEFEQDISYRVTDLYCKEEKYYEINPYGEIIITRGKKKIVAEAGRYLMARNMPSYKQPYGESVLTRLYYPWTYQRIIGESYARYGERYGLPMAHFKGGNPNDPLFKKLLELFKGKKRPASFSTPDNVELELIQPSSGFDYKAYIECVTAEIRIAILGETLTSAMTEGNGSQAAATVHDDVRLEKIAADKELIIKTMNHLIWMVCQYNRIENPPTFQFIERQAVNKELAERDVILANLTGKNFSPEYIEQMYGVKPEHLADMVEELDEQFNFTHWHSLTERDVLQFNENQRAIMQLEDNAINQAGDAIPLLMTAINSAKSPQDLEKKLREFSEAPLDDQFTEAMFRALFQMDITGYTNAR